MLKDIGGHLYWKILSRGKRTYWRCTFIQTGWDGTSNTKCGGKGLTSDDNVTLTLAHNHYGDENRIEAKRFQGIIQKQAVSSKELPRRIIGSALKEIPKQAWGHIRRSFVASNIRNIRHENKLEPGNPKNLQLLVVPIDFRMFYDEVFLKFDGWNGAELVLIFSTNKFLIFLSPKRTSGRWNLLLAQRSMLDLTLPEIYAFDSFFYPELAKKDQKMCFIGRALVFGGCQYPDEKALFL
uniref:FLYWCH-type domain-containing protein n=1 Tax=Ditylenchus dipsaci TaxID=166011 RepID=A0A915EUL0_9BILA